MDMQVDQNLEANSRLQYPPVSAIEKTIQKTETMSIFCARAIVYPESVRDWHLNAKNTLVQRPSTADEKSPVVNAILVLLHSAGQYSRQQVYAIVKNIPGSG